MKGKGEQKINHTMTSSNFFNFFIWHFLIIIVDHWFKQKMEYNRLTFFVNYYFNFIHDNYCLYSCTRD